MKGKLLGFVTALLAVATIGAVQLTTNAATPGQVGSAPRCTVTSVGPRSTAFKVHGNSATVTFKATGSKNCKVQVSTFAFYAPSMTGKPYNKQILYAKNTRVVTRGTHTMNIAVPTTSTHKKGCYYQLDLSYSNHIVSPVLAYGHGTINCGKPPKPPKPTAQCDGLQVTKINRTKFRLNGHASTTGKASIRAYTFSMLKGGKTVQSQTVKTSAKSASTTMTQTTPGTYKVRLTVKTSVGNRTSASCVKSLTVKPPVVKPHPGVAIAKMVNNQKSVEVAKGEVFTYQLAVRNTGNVDLKNVNVTDTPEDGVVLIGASKGTISGNTWTYTIPKLAVGETQHFTIRAKVPNAVGVVLDNKACVDASEVPGKPDDCDHAKVKVPKPEEKITVCDLDSKEIITIKERDFDASKHSTDLSLCEETPEVPPTEETPPALPETGPAEAISQLIGLASLVGASAYYIISRRA